MNVEREGFNVQTSCDSNGQTNHKEHKIKDMA